MSDPSPAISIIMPVRNEAPNLEVTLDALLAGDYPGRLEILVVDGMSEDATKRVALAAAERDRRVRVLDNPQRRTPGGLNVGLAAAAGEIIVRMDGHARPAPDYVRSCVNALQRTGAWCVGGRMIGRGDTPFGRAVAALSRMPIGAGDARFRVGAVRTGGEAVDTVYLGAWPRWVFDRVGGFDEGLSQNQDYELAYRIRRAGGLVWLDPAIRSETLTRGTFGALARQYWRYGQGRAATLLRHPHSLRWRQLVPILFVAMLVMLLVYSAATYLWAANTLGAARGTWPPSGAAWSILVLLSVYGSALMIGTVKVARREGWRVARHVPLALATMHIAWGAGAWYGLATNSVKRLQSGHQ